MDALISKYLIVGLGNPGKKYADTRHNAGFMALDLFAKKHRIEFKKENKKYWHAWFSFKQVSVDLIKPNTFMNLSGEAVADYLKNHPIHLSNLIVICDDINLPFGTIRIRQKGSDGGQKGLRSIIQHLESESFPRLRIGIGNTFEDAAEYVLSRFKESEEKELQLVLENAVTAIESIIECGIENAMSRFNKNHLQRIE